LEISKSKRRLLFINMYNSLSKIYLNNILLKEYSEKTIVSFIEKFKPQTTESSENIRKNILQFEKIKDSDRFKKLTPKIIPNVTTPSDLSGYSYLDLIKILAWFEGEGAEKYKVPLEPQEATKMPERLPEGDAVGLEIYIAHTYEQARYLAIEHFCRFYNYCVRIRGHWNSYRYRDNQTFYFVYDPDKQKDDPNHLLVIRPVPSPEGGISRYAVSNAKNADTPWVWGDERNASPIYNIIKQQPKLTTLKHLFVPKKHTARELKDIELGTKSNPTNFKLLDYYTKTQYITLGHKIFPEDYELLDKDLQNLYINAQDNWENIEVNTEVVSGLYSLIYPFATQDLEEENWQNTNTQRKLLGLYIVLRLARASQDFNLLFKIHKVIDEGSPGAKKRYLALLERNREKIFSVSTKYAVLLIERILAIRTSPTFRDIFNEGIPSIIQLLGPEEQKVYIEQKQVIITNKEFNDLPVENQKFYITAWFMRNGAYKNNNKLNFKSVIAPFTDINDVECNKILNQSETLEDFVNNHPGLKTAEHSVKQTFLTELKKYANKNIERLV
jgi:hypothetical protein